MATYPEQPTEFPSAFNGFGERMLHPRIAIWHKTDYQIYDVNRDGWPAVRLTPTNSDRTTPFYFAEGTGDNQSRTVTIYRPRARLHSHIDMAIWHTGGWLCRKHGNQLEAVIPILAVSEPTKLIWVGNVGIHNDCAAFREWLSFQTPFFYRPIVHNRILMRLITQQFEDKPAASTIDPIPLFVAEMLLDKAIADEEPCPISIDPLKKGESVVTSCFHIFQKDALDTWRIKHTTCPVCKKECCVTVC